MEGAYFNDQEMELIKKTFQEKYPWRNFNELKFVKRLSSFHTIQRIHLTWHDKDLLLEYEPACWSNAQDHCYISEYV